MGKIKPSEPQVLVFYFYRDIVRITLDDYTKDLAPKPVLELLLSSSVKGGPRLRPQVSIFKDHDANDWVQENREGWVSPSPRENSEGVGPQMRGAVSGL